ncbi:MAG TPA: prolipoprotein diacylglyceryl transferase [candidate division Zixibacteria bacterium]|nr:prolipoprotein diacylglyceryl transferase [candidate division Zixibacteria bacterium]
MHPELFSIGRFSVKSWGLMLAISVVISTILAVRRSKKFGVDPNIIYDLIFVVVVSAIVGSRLWYVAFHLDEFSGNWLDIVNPFSGPGGFGIAGLSMMGGVALVVITVAIYAWIKKLNFPLVGDVIAPMFLLGAGITRIGCFLNGCCYGRPTSGALSCVFTDGPAASYWQQFIHTYPASGMTGLIPTQLIASAASFALFFFVLWIEKWRYFPGYTSWIVLTAYSIKRFAVDQFRTYPADQVLGHIGPFMITVNEIILAGLVIFSAIMFVIGSSKARKHKGQKA